MIRGPRPSNPVSRAEIIVIGSGPGGSLSACLAAEAGRDVVLIEEGPHLAPQSCEPFSLDEMVTKYRRGGITVALGRTQVPYVEGCCVGGGSEVNSGLYHRVPPEVLDQWRRDLGVADLASGDLTEHQEAIERELCVSHSGQAPAASQRLHQGAASLGWKSIAVPRWFRASPSGPPEKQTMTRTYIPRFLAAGGRLLCETRVVRLRRAARGFDIHAVAPGGSGDVLRADAVFLAAGAVQTPAILRRGGIRHCIGDSLRMHPTVKMVAVFDEPVNDLGMGVPVHQVKEFAPTLSLGCSISAPPHLALAMADHSADRAAVMKNWTHAAVYYAMTGGGSGTVRPLPGFRDPLVRYRFSPRDYRELHTALLRLGECLLAAGARTLYASVPGTGPIHDAADLVAACQIERIPSASLMTIHLFGSCPMGEAKDRTAVDSWGRVHNVPGLLLADGSILGGPPGVNPQGTIMSLARRNVLRFLESLSP